MGAVRILGCLCVRQTLHVTTHCRSPWCMGSIRGDASVSCKCRRGCKPRPARSVVSKLLPQCVTWFAD